MEVNVTSMSHELLRNVKALIGSIETKLLILDEGCTEDTMQLQKHHEQQLELLEKLKGILQRTL